MLKIKSAGRSTATIDIGDIRLSSVQHMKLVQYLHTRLDVAQRMRATYIDVFKYIDNEYHTWLLRDADDSKRMKDNLKGIGIKPVDEKLSMIFAQIDEAQTYLLSVLAPEESMYSATAKRAEQSVAKGFATLMNQHADTFKHYNELAIFLVDAMKYNFGSYGVHWEQRIGNMLTSDNVGRPVIQKTVVADGNEICAFDPYNTLMDPSVNPVQCSEHGEFFGVVKMETPFRLRKRAADDELFQIDQMLAMTPSNRYYMPRNQVRGDIGGGNGGGVTDFVAILSGMAGDEMSDTPIVAIETIPMHCWIIPNRFGLSKSKDYEIWRFILGGNFILDAKQMTNAHAMLPINVAMPWQDHFGWQTKGPAERLIPHQRFASFTMNVHQRAVRKRLIGLTIYDQAVIPLMSADNVDMEGGRIAANTNGQDVDLRKKIIQFTDGPDTTNTLENINITSDLMQQILPTKMAQQVAGLDRATQYQAAATVQSANRRNLKIAKIIDAQAMQSGRKMQMMNILQFQPSVELLDDAGETIQINPAQLRATKLQFTISDGLKGIDKLSLILNIKEILNAVMQSQQASAQLDVVGIINYWTSMLGDNTDFTQFRTQSPIDKLPVDQRNLAMQLLQQYVAQAEEAKKSGQSQPPAAVAA